MAPYDEVERMKEEFHRTGGLPSMESPKAKPSPTEIQPSDKPEFKYSREVRFHSATRRDLVIYGNDAQELDALESKILYGK